MLAGLALAGWGQARLNNNLLDQGLRLYAAAVVCWLLALSRTEWLRNNVAMPLRPLSRRAEWIGLAVVLLVGAFFRFYRLADVPWGMSIDGSANALKVLEILQGAPYEPLYLARETMYHYIVAGFFKLFGPSQLVFRAASATLGMAALLTLFLAVRELFDARLALLAAALMAVSTYHLTYSRNEWRAIQVPVFAMLALFLVLRALRLGDRPPGANGRQQRVWPWWLAAGASVGLGLNTYESFRLVVIALAVLILTWVGRGAVRAGWPYLRRQIPHLALFLLFSLLFFGPLGIEAFTNWNSFSARANTVFIGERIRQARSLQPLWDNLRNLVLTFNYHAIGDFFDNAKPLLNPVEAVLFVGGLTMVLGNFWRWRPALLLLWLAVTSLAGLFSWPNAQRLIATVPLVYVLGALFLYAAWVLLDDLPWRRLRRSPAITASQATRATDWAVTPVVIAVIAAAAWQTWQVYLGPQRRIVWGYEPERLVVAQYVKPLRDSDHVIIEERFNQGQVQFVNWRPGDSPYERIFPLYDYHQDLPLRRSLDRPVTIVLEDRPELRALIPIYQAFYPNLTVDELPDHYNPQRSVAFALRISQADLQASWGWQPAGVGRWQALLDVPQLQQAELAVPAEPTAQVWVDDAPVDGPVLLTPGLHPVRVEGTSVAPELWWNGQPVPRERLFTVANFSESWQLSRLRGAPARYQPLSWRQVLRFGGTGQQPGQFFRPIAIAVVQPDGAILVADVDNVRVQRFDANGTFQAEFGQRGTAPGQLEHEFGTALDGQGLLYLADRWNDRVQAFTVDGDFVRVVVQAGSVRDVLVEPGGTLLVTVPGAQQVWRISTDGQVLLTMGVGGMQTGQLQEPIGVAQDAQGNIYVNDAGRKAVLKFSPDGQFLLEWPAPFVTWESYVAVSPDGNVYVSAPDENTIHAFTPDGVLLVQGTPESGYNPFDQPLNHPMGLTFDSAGHLYVTSTYSDEVVKFAPVTLGPAQP